MAQGTTSAGTGLPMEADTQIRAVIFDFGDTLIYEVVDDEAPLHHYEIKLRPSARAVVERLHAHGLKLAILSNTEQTTSDQLRTVLRKLEIEQFFSVVLTSSDLALEGIAEPAKPSKEIYRRMLEALGLAPLSCVMVGNTVADDIQGATSAGLNAVLYAPDTFLDVVIEHPLSVAVSSVISLDELDQRVELIQQANDHYLLARAAFERLRFQEAIAHYRSSAKISLVIHDRWRASALFARTAIAQEHTELWRETSLAWYQAAESLKSTAVLSNRKHIEYDLTEHHYPSISMAQWDSVHMPERRAKAYRYAGYHAQNTNSPQDAYLLYRLSADVYESLEQYDKAAEVLLDAALSFIKEYGDIDDEYLKKMGDLLDRIPPSSVGVDVGELYLKRIAGALFSCSNTRRGEHVLVTACARQAKRLLRTKRYPAYLAYLVWNITSRYGTSTGRWLAWSVALCCGVFPALLRLSNALAGKRIWFDYWYASFLAFTTVSVVDSATSPLAKSLLSAEIMCGYVFIAILVTLIFRRMSH